MVQVENRSYPANATSAHPAGADVNAAAAVHRTEAGEIEAVRERGLRRSCNVAVVVVAMSARLRNIAPPAVVWR
jgi:uncharacterized membrane protein